MSGYAGNEDVDTTPHSKSSNIYVSMIQAPFMVSSSQ
jgi:hypothetical protein